MFKREVSFDQGEFLPEVVSLQQAQHNGQAQHAVVSLGRTCLKERCFLIRVSFYQRWYHCSKLSPMGKHSSGESRRCMFKREVFSPQGGFHQQLHCTMEFMLLVAAEVNSKSSNLGLTGHL